MYTHDDQDVPLVPVICLLVRTRSSQQVTLSLSRSRIEPNRA